MAAKLGGIPELVTEGTTGWLHQPGDKKDFEHIIRWCLTHPAELQRAGAAGSRAFRGRTLERYAQEIVVPQSPEAGADSRMIS